MTQRQWLILAAAIAAVVAVTALVVWRPWATPQERPAGLTVNGVAYELPLVADPKDLMAVAAELLKARTATGVKWSNGIHALEVADGEVRLNGESYGTVKEGDRLKLTEGGDLFVNGVERKPELSGISVEVRGEVFVSTSSNAGEGKAISSGNNKFEIKKGRAFANGRDGGPLKSGDSVVLDKEGRLFVNGQERTLK